MRTAKRSSTFYEVFTAYDFDGITRLSGLALDDGITIAAFKNGVSIGAQSFTVSEISSGNYLLTTTFDTKGYWTLFIRTVDTGTGVIIEEQRVDVEVSIYTLDEVYGAASGTASAGLGSETLTITFQDSNNGNAVVPGVAVNVFNATKTAYITFATSNTSGQVVFNLDPGTFTFTSFLAGYSFTETTQTVSDTDGLTPQSAAITGASATVAAPTKPNVCRFFANFVKQGGTPISGYQVVVRTLYDATSATNLSVAESTKTYTSNTSGHVQFDVVRGIEIEVTLVSTSITTKISVPNQAVQNLLDLISEVSSSTISLGTTSSSSSTNIVIVGA